MEGCPLSAVGKMEEAALGSKASIHPIVSLFPSAKSEVSP